MEVNLHAALQPGFYRKLPNLPGWRTMCVKKEVNMKNPNIARVLKEYRKLNHYSVEDVAKKLEEYQLFFATKTIYGWENGQTQPDADTLLVLCKIYKIDHILETFGYMPSDELLLLSEEEHSLIEKYREHTEMQTAVKRLLDLGEG